jgi:hypothetical protein
MPSNPTTQACIKLFVMPSCIDNCKLSRIVEPAGTKLPVCRQTSVKVGQRHRIQIAPVPSVTCRNKRTQVVLRQLFQPYEAKIRWQVHESPRGRCTGNPRRLGRLELTSAAAPQSCTNAISHGSSRSPAHHNFVARRLCVLLCSCKLLELKP